MGVKHGVDGFGGVGGVDLDDYIGVGTIGNWGEAQSGGGFAIGLGMDHDSARAVADHLGDCHCAVSNLLIYHGYGRSHFGVFFHGDCFHRRGFSWIWGGGGTWQAASARVKIARRAMKRGKLCLVMGIFSFGIKLANLL